MDNMNAAPVDHGVLSATGSVAAGAGGGFLKSGIKGFGITVLTCAAIGAVWAVTGGLGIFGSLLWGGAVGALAGIVPGMIIGGTSSAVGAYTGGSRALNEVKAEKGAANVVQAQVEAYKSQAQAQAYAAAAANDNEGKYRFPATGTRFNEAASSIQADTAQGFGQVAGQGLQRA